MTTRLKLPTGEKHTLMTELVLIQSILCFIDEFMEKVRSRELGVPS